MASIASNEWGPYEIDNGTYTFKFSYVTPEGESLLSPASNAVVVDAVDQYVDLSLPGLDSQYWGVPGCYRRIWVSKDSGPYYDERLLGTLDAATYIWCWPYSEGLTLPSGNTTGLPWGYAEFFAAQEFAVTLFSPLVGNESDNLSDVLGWGTLDVGAYRLTVTYPAWSIPYDYFTFMEGELVDQDEFTVEIGISTKAFVYDYVYQVLIGCTVDTEWSMDNCPVFDQIQSEEDLAAAQASWDEGWVNHYNISPIPQSFDWEIIYQTGDTFESGTDPSINGFGSLHDWGCLGGRPCTLTGAGTWHSLGVRTAYRPSAVGQFGYEFKGPYSYAEMRPIADLLANKVDHGGTGIPWIRHRVDTSPMQDGQDWGNGIVGYNEWKAWGNWAPTENWGIIPGLYCSYVHTPADYPARPGTADPNQWTLP